MVWMSTVALGWHYALDGLGGIALAAVCIPITHLLMRPLKLEDEAPRRDP
jgi:membrane-associated phospholipid phosphatase